MKYLRLVLIASVLIVMSLGGAMAVETTTSARYITEDEVPPTVIKGIKKDYPGITFKKFEEEIWGKTKLYEILSEVNGEEIDLVYSADGKRVSYEVWVPIEELPKKVKALIFANKFIENNEGEETVFYELGVTDDRNKILYSFQCSEDGKFLGMLKMMTKENALESPADDVAADKEQVSIADLPLEVRKRILAERTVENKTVFYNLGFKDEIGRRLYWFKCSKDGKFLGKI